MWEGEVDDVCVAPFQESDEGFGGAVVDFDLRLVALLVPACEHRSVKELERDQRCE